MRGVRRILHEEPWSVLEVRTAAASERLCALFESTCWCVHRTFDAQRYLPLYFFMRQRGDRLSLIGCYSDRDRVLSDRANGEMWRTNLALFSELAAMLLKVRPKCMVMESDGMLIEKVMAHWKDRRHAVRKLLLRGETALAAGIFVPPFLYKCGTIGDDIRRLTPKRYLPDLVFQMAGRLIEGKTEGQFGHRRGYMNLSMIFADELREGIRRAAKKMCSLAVDRALKACEKRNQKFFEALDHYVPPAANRPGRILIDTETAGWPTPTLAAQQVVRGDCGSHGSVTVRVGRGGVGD